MLRNVHEAKTHFSKYLDLAAAGEEIILAKAGKPVAKLVPLNTAESKAKTPKNQPAKARKRKLGQYQGWVVPDSAFEPMRNDELQTWYNGEVFP